MHVPVTLMLCIVMTDSSILQNVADWISSAHFLTHLRISNFAKTRVFLFPLFHLFYILICNKPVSFELTSLTQQRKYAIRHRGFDPHLHLYLSSLLC